MVPAKIPTHRRGGYHPPARAALFGISPVEWYQPQNYRQDLPLGEGAPACRGGRGRRDAMIHSDIPGKMVHCTDSPQNVHEITAYCGPLQSCFARQLPPGGSSWWLRDFLPFNEILNFARLREIISSLQLAIQPIRQSPGRVVASRQEFRKVAAAFSSMPLSPGSRDRSPNWLLVVK